MKVDAGQCMVAGSEAAHCLVRNMAPPLFYIDQRLGHLLHDTFILLSYVESMLVQLVMVVVTLDSLRQKNSDRT